MNAPTHRTHNERPAADLCTCGGAAPPTELPSPAAPPDAVQVTGDARPEGPTALSVVLLGTGAGPYPAPGRQGASTAVVVGDRTYLVDAGYGALRKYAQAGLRLSDLRAVFLTHLHSDHTADLFNLFLLGWGPANHGVNQPVHIAGPGPDRTLPDHPQPGTEGLLTHLLAAFGQDVAVRLRTSARTPLADLVRPHDLVSPPAGQDVLVYEDDRVRVTAREVPHPPLHQSFGYRFETEEGVVAFSGDTAYSDSVGELAEGADLLVHETMEPDFYRGLGYSDRLLDFLTASHTAPGDVGRLATAAGVRRVALSHIGPPDPREVGDDDWTRKVAATYSGPVVVGHDLTRLVPAR
ncbi:MBL fold metallo-hydrolase [Streptomyces sp. BH097]|uniref:MBL fold metallo-hydrolase n=1 Tax=unclassified Streptomyces TaxID=2593676 RepID=UPI003BB49F42